MNDLTELKRQMAEVGLWIDAYLGRPGREWRTFASFGFARLAEYFPASLLERALATQVEKIELPPVQSLGAKFSEFTASAPVLGGATFKGCSFLISETWDSESAFLHELIHQIQWDEAGADLFLLAYGDHVARNGYIGLPFEEMAYAIQGRFNQGEALVGIEGFVRRKTREIVAAYRDA